MSRVLALALFVTMSSAVSGSAALAQTAVGGQVSSFKDTSMLKPPPGARVAIIEWEDLECPACAHAFPLVHQAIAHYHIPLVRYDFLIPGHMWSKQAAVYARYIQDKVSPDIATEYRREVFASQFRIASQDDLVKFTQQFFAAHGKQMPFVVDPTGELLKQVEADRNLGDKLGLNETPTIVIVTPKGWIQVKDVSDLYQAIDQAEAMAGSGAATVHRTSARK
ncbi:thioredoxin domain-containing protein [Granulicella sp. 5B5]|uniref:DsbA family protein n=1 Tax=Granulicella sp. 5B5 TaxID=1617967 RepID=UPI0015F4B253|nr:thioredoxin domain-containing protein [Granulicella sp. 5B5]QMV18582.1 thioredoxin domain-containing protein [Granulicella sp. 5B5]